MAAKALDKKRLHREIDRDLRKKAREKVVALRDELRAARRERKAAIVAAVERCRSERLAARERARALRIRGLAELREATRLEREAARSACTVRKGEAKSKEGVERRRAELAAERAYQADLRRIARGNKARMGEHRLAKGGERRAESDDEVLQNLPAELVPLFQRVKRMIKATPRMSRTEAMLRYGEEHPREVLEVIEDRTEAVVRELEERQAAAAGRARRRGRSSGALADAVPL